MTRSEDPDGLGIGDGEFESSEAAPPLDSAPAVREGESFATRVVTAMTKRRTMRLLVGLPIVYAVLLMYVGLLVGVAAGWVGLTEAKELAGLISVPATLAATVVGFFFGRAARPK